MRRKLFCVSIKSRGYFVLRHVLRVAEKVEIQAGRDLVIPAHPVNGLFQAVPDLITAGQVRPVHERVGRPEVLEIDFGPDLENPFSEGVSDLPKATTTNTIARTGFDRTARTRIEPVRSVGKVQRFKPQRQVIPLR